MTLHHAVPTHTGRELQLLWRVEAALPARSPLPLRLSAELIEPGIFGIFRPVLVWPQRLTDRLEDEHIEAIFIHELMHVRRRDNLTAAIHMLVEAALWFHPLVWWIGRRLIDERERACDEAVVQLGGRAEAYAESLLKACRFCIESPLPCVSGITGANLAERVRSIMTAAFAAKLTLSKKLVLIAAAAATVAAPLGIGQIAAISNSLVMARFMQVQEPAPPPPPPPPPGWKALHPTGRLPSFEVATIKPSKPDEQANILWSPALFHAWHQSVRQLVKIAYNINDDSQLTGGPAWIDREFFDIEAKPEQSQIQAFKRLGASVMMDQSRLMLQSLLENRFRLRITGDTRVLPVFALTLAKAKPNLKSVTTSPEIAGSPKPPIPPRPPPPTAGATQKLLPPPTGFPTLYKSGANQLTATTYRMSWFCDWLSRQGEIHRPVLDRTGLDGNYDFVLNGIAVSSTAAEP